jgi:hypothetical protein
MEALTKLTLETKAAIEAGVLMLSQLKWNGVQGI